MKSYKIVSQVLLTIVVLCGTFTCTSAQVSLSATPNIPSKHEVRAVWLTTIGGLDWPHTYAQSERSAARQKQELLAILDKLQHAGINTILFQTRIRATMVYPSSIEPWDGCLSGFPGKNPGYDALAFAIDECHKRGMELHAWVVTIPVGKWNGPGCSALRKAHPELLRRIGQEGYMNPETPGTADYLSHICAEITRNYDVDGIHLDYIRYPETWKITVSKDQGRQFITRIVKQIHDAVKQAKPWVKMSCSPIGKHDDLSRYWSHGWNAYSTVCQEAQNWLKDGLMDELFPMMYFRDNNFFPFAIDWKEQSHGKIVVPGLGIYFMHPKEKDWDLASITREMEVSRQYGMGHAFFRCKFFTDNLKGIYDFAANTFNTYPTLIPPMTWKAKSCPKQPSQLTVTRKDSTTDIAWSGAVNTNDSPYLIYNIYASRQYPVDTRDPRNLIAARYTHNSISMKPVEGMYFAVSALDRYGNESQALQQAYTDCPQSSTRIVRTDGKKLQLDSLVVDGEAEYLVFESLAGNMVSTAKLASSVDISQIPDGVYTLRSINKRGIQHRLAMVIIKRQESET